MSINATGGLVGGNLVISRAGGATANLTGVAATAATTYTVQNLTYTIAGKLYFKVTAVTAAAPVTDVVSGLAFKPLQKNQGCAYLWTVDAFGNVGLAQGPLPISPATTGLQTNVDDSGNFIIPPQFPTVPDTLSVFAYSIIRTTSAYAGTGYQPGVSNWNTTGVVTTATDLMEVPATLQTA